MEYDEIYVNNNIQKRKEEMLQQMKSHNVKDFQKLLPE